MMFQPITVVHLNQFGRKRIFFEDAKKRKAWKAITGKITITPAQAYALAELAGGREHGFHPNRMFQRADAGHAPGHLRYCQPSPKEQPGA